MRVTVQEEDIKDIGPVPDVLLQISAPTDKI